MTETELRKRVREMVLEAAPIRTGREDGSAELVGDLGYDSLGREELAALLEDEFAGLRIPDTTGVVTVSDVESLVVRLTGVQGRCPG